VAMAIMLCIIVLHCNTSSWLIGSFGPFRSMVWVQLFGRDVHFYLRVGGWILGLYINNFLVYNLWLIINHFTVNY
jgi:hypothetical protein